MKILLVNPPRFKKIPVVREVRCAGMSPASIYHPVQLSYMAGNIEQHGFEVKILDCNAFNYGFEAVAEMINEFEPNLVLFTTSPPTMSYDMGIAKITKKINNRIKTVLDDSHIAPAMPGRVLSDFKDLDIIIKGESEFTVLDLINNLHNLDYVKGISYRDKNGQIHNNEPREPGDLDSLPYPAYHLLPLDKYFSLTFSKSRPFASIITSVSCPYRCTFCIIGGATVWRGYGNTWRAKSPEKVVSEILYLKERFKINSFYFFDETFTIDRNRVISICDRLIKEKINIEWSCNSRVDTVDEELLLKMKKAGCWNISYGVETAWPHLLESINKMTNIEKAIENFKISRKLKLNASASFMIGFPEDTKETLLAILKLAKKLDPFMAQFVITTPYPGTKLYEDAQRRGLIEREYSFCGFDAYGLDQEPALRTETMSSQDIIAMQRYINRKFYLRPAFIFRNIFRMRSFFVINSIIKNLLG